MDRQIRDDRGTIVKMTVHIEYPDGRTKETTYGRAWCQEAGALLLHESCMWLDQIAQFNAEDDWEKRPTFLKWHRDETRADGCNGTGTGGGTCTECCACDSCHPK